MKKIAIIGLGYVGLPLARLFATKYPVVGFDINSKWISELQEGIDTTLEIPKELLESVLVENNPLKSDNNGLFCSSQLEDITEANIYILLQFRLLWIRIITPTLHLFIELVKP